jgi:hypothetical protein
MTYSPLHRFVVLGLVTLGISGCAAQRSATKTSNTGRTNNGEIQFALIGDMPYDALQATNLFPNLIRELNATDLAFVVHDGDIKAGATPCTDDCFEAVRAQFQTIRHPLVYLFGDNEWSDCGKVKTNSFDPLERLQKLRDVFTQGAMSLGQRKMPLERQSSNPNFAAYRENVRWTVGGVSFAGMNVPGDDNFTASKEFAARNAANIAWMREAFAVAAKEDARAVMLIIQANPHFEVAATNRLRKGFNEMLRVMEQETIAFGKPVVLVHGDSHYFRIDQPMIGSKSKRRVENFLRVETYGNPDVHWLRVAIEPNNPNVFRFERQLVRENLVNHSR